MKHQFQHLTPADITTHTQRLWAQGQKHPLLYHHPPPAHQHLMLLLSMMALSNRAMGNWCKARLDIDSAGWNQLVLILLAQFYDCVMLCFLRILSFCLIRICVCVCVFYATTVLLNRMFDICGIFFSIVINCFQMSLILITAQRTRAFISCVFFAWSFYLINFGNDRFLAKLTSLVHRTGEMSPHVSYVWIKVI